MQGSRRSSSTFHPRRNKLKSPREAQSQCTLRLVGVLERQTAKSRVKPCLTEDGVGDSDKGDGTEVADGAGEEADIRSFILERLIESAESFLLACELCTVDLITTLS